MIYDEVIPLYIIPVVREGSASLFGVISACSFIPMILLCPIGGIIADRVNKRNMMVLLDFSTALLTFILTLLLGKVDLILLLLVIMIFLYGIQGAYQPAVQASIPALVDSETILPANAIINLISSLSGLLGPVLGGILYAAYGLMPILYGIQDRKSLRFLSLLPLLICFSAP